MYGYIPEHVVGQNERPQVVKPDVPPVRTEDPGVLSGRLTPPDLPELGSAADAGTDRLVLPLWTVAVTVRVCVLGPAGDLVVGQVQLLQTGREPGQWTQTGEAVVGHYQTTCNIELYITSVLSTLPRCGARQGSDEGMSLNEL